MHSLSADGEVSGHDVRAGTNASLESGRSSEAWAPHIASLLRTAELGGASAPIPGNKVSLLIGGRQTFAAMIQAIRDATDHVNFESYIIDDDEVGRAFAQVLLEKQRQGVQVNVIYDGAGSRKTPRVFFENLKKEGVNVVEFNPLNPLRGNTRQPFFERNHRKMLVVDGTVAFTGGVNIGKAYYYDLYELGLDPQEYGEGSQVWRDSHVRVEGPAAAEFQKLFLETWAEQNGPPLAEGHYFPFVQPSGPDWVQVAGSKRGTSNRGTYIMYLAAIRHARHSIHLTQAYFVPDRQTIDALKDAAIRGIDVRIILPEFNDHAVVLQAGRSFYRELLEAGVRLYERCCANLHAKTAVIDGVWSTVGSTNMERWSLSISHEANAIIVGSAFGKEMETMFTDDLKDSREITGDEWDRRPWSDKLKQGLTRIIRRWL